MLIVLNTSYQPIATSEMTIAQGDAALGRLYVVAPPAVGISVAFGLPDGTVTQKYPLFMNIAQSDYDVNYFVYTLNVTSDIFAAVPGKLAIQLYASISGDDGAVQTYAVPTVEMNVLKGVVTIPQAGVDIPSDETWTALLAGIGTLSNQVGLLTRDAVTLLSGQINMWGLKTGFYKVAKGSRISMLSESATGIIENADEDMLLFVVNKTLKNASYIAMSTLNGKSSTGTMTAKPSFIYGYSNRTSYSKETFTLKNYAEPYIAGYGQSIDGQKINVSLPIAETQSV